MSQNKIKTDFLLHSSRLLLSLSSHTSIFAQEGYASAKLWGSKVQKGS